MNPIETLTNLRVNPSVLESVVNKSMFWPRFGGNNQLHGVSSFAGPASLDKFWVFSKNSSIINSVVINSENNIYVSDASNAISCLTPSGSLMWTNSDEFTKGAPIALGKDGSLYVGTFKGGLSSLSKHGSLRWKHFSFDIIYSTPLVLSDNRIVYADFAGKVYLLEDFRTYEVEVWKKAVGTAQFFGPISSSINEDRLFLGNLDKYMYAVDVASGSTIFKYETNGVIFGGATVDENDNIYFCGDAVVYSLDVAGSLRWTFQALGSMTVTPALKDDILYFGTSKGSYYAVTTAGSLLWARSLDTVFYNSFVVDANNIIYGGSYKLFAIDGSNGKVIHEFLLRNTYESVNVAASGVLDRNGSVIISNTQGFVYALNVKSKNETTRSPSQQLSFKPSFAPTIIPTISNDSKAASISSIIIILAALIATFVLCVIGCLIVYFYNLQLKLKEEMEQDSSNWEKQGRNPIFGTLPRGSVRGSNLSCLTPPSSTPNTYRSLKPEVIRRRNSVVGLEIDWDDIHIEGENANQAIIGHGSFGTVIKGKWSSNRQGITQEFDVAVKVLTRATITSSDFDQICDKAYHEVELIKEAERNMSYNDCIIHVYGVAEGRLPLRLTTMFHIEYGEEGVGIVMRYEGGGSLDGLIHPKSDKNDGGNNIQKPNLSINEKIRLLTGVARGITELHALGIIHADIKPANILLSHHNPPEVRLADFGLSTFSGNNGQNNQDNNTAISYLEQTKHLRGTPVYCAPEMLVNPYNDSINEFIAKSSRKTDIYAFGLLCWEVLAQEKPFGEIKTEGMLCAKVHQGYRPSLEKLPKDTPPGIISLIESCWNKDRTLRKSAVECLSVLEYSYQVLTETSFDIYFSHEPESRHILSYVFHHLSRAGYKVYFEQSDNQNIEGVSKSKVVVACINRKYQENETCMFEIKETKNLNPPKPIVTLITEEDPLSWATSELVEYTQLKSNLYVNVSKFAKENFHDNDDDDDAEINNSKRKQKKLEKEKENNENEKARKSLNGKSGKSERAENLLLEELNKCLAPLIKLLNDLGCRPGKELQHS